MYLDSNNKIIVPYGGQGLFSTYQYSDGEICIVE